MYPWIKNNPWPSAFVILLIASFATRWLMLGHPGSAVFDEVHFNYFAGFYFTGQYFYDIHPPLGKLLIALSALPYGGIEPEDIVRTISTPYPSETYVALRMIPALTGTCIPLLMFLIARELKLSVGPAFLAGAFALLDNALLIQARLILLDSMLLFFGFSCLWLFLRARKSHHWGSLCLAAVFAGCAISIKWIGVSFLGLVGLVMLVEWGRELWLRGWTIQPFYRGCIFLSITVTTYIAIFFLHFSLLPLSHKQGDQFMSRDFQSTLQGSRYYGASGAIRQFSCPPNYSHKLSYWMPNTEVKASEELACRVKYEPINTPGFWGKFAELNRIMYTTNQGLSQSHPDASKWYTWPLMSKPLYYWHHEGARIYLMGNMLIWWFGTLAVLLLLVGQYKFSSWRQKEAFWILMTGFWANLVPFALVNRVMFMYHYLTSLCFAILLTAFLVQQMRDVRWLSPALTQKLPLIMTTAAGLMFILLSPLTYGINWFGSDLLWLLRIFGWHP